MKSATKRVRKAKAQKTKPSPKRSAKTLPFALPDDEAQQAIEPPPEPVTLGRRALDAWITLAAPGSIERKLEVADEIADLMTAQGYVEADPTERMLIDRLAIASLQVTHAEMLLAACTGRDAGQARYWSNQQQQATNMLFQATKAIATYRKLAGIKRTFAAGPPPPRSQHEFIETTTPVLKDDPDVVALLQSRFRETLMNPKNVGQPLF